MSLFNEEKVPLGRYALRAIPPTNVGPSRSQVTGD